MSQDSTDSPYFTQRTGPSQLPFLIRWMNAFAVLLTNEKTAKRKFHLSENSKPDNEHKEGQEKCSEPVKVLYLKAGEDKMITVV